MYLCSTFYLHLCYTKIFTERNEPGFQLASAFRADETTQAKGSYKRESKEHTRE